MLTVMKLSFDRSTGLDVFKLLTKIPSVAFEELFADNDMCARAR